MKRTFIIIATIFISFINIACSSSENLNPEYVQMRQMFDAIVEDCTNLHKDVKDIDRATYMFKNSFFNELVSTGVSVMDAQILTGFAETICHSAMNCDDFIGNKHEMCKDKLSQYIDVTIEDLMGIPKENI